jgi:hypothetical protein
MAADKLDRDKMYGGDAGDPDGDYELAPIDAEPAPVAPPRAAADFDDDDAELELEPVDAEILAAAKRRAEEAVVAATRTIDVDQIYRDIEPSREIELPTELFKDFRFQFQVKHLLIATAVLAVLLTIVRVFGPGGGIAILFMLVVFAATAYFNVQERKRQAEADQRRQQMYAARREKFGGPGGRAANAASDGDSSVARRLKPEELESVRVSQPSPAGPSLLSRLSIVQWLAAAGCAAILIWIVYAVGGAQNGAMLFGLIALGGLVAHGLGYDPPEVVAFAWWLILMLYLALGVGAAVWHGIAG